jgi:hypothetical protein
MVFVHKYLERKNAKRSRLRWPTPGGQAMAARERNAKRELQYKRREKDLGKKADL